MGFKITL